MCTWRIWGWIDVEAKRVLLSKTFLAVLAGLLALNTFLFLYYQSMGTGDFRGFATMYHEAVEELSAYSNDRAESTANRRYEEVLSDRKAEGWSNSSDFQWRLGTWNQLKDQYASLNGYGDYLIGVQSAAQVMQSVSIFGDPNSITYKNTVKTAEDFAKMLDVEVTPGHDLAVTKVFDDDWADYSILILMVLLCGMFLSDRKEGLWPMIYAAPGGRAKLAAKRVGILLAGAWIVTLVIIGSRILLSGWLYYGLDEWDRVLQSIGMFQNVPTPMTVGQFWLFYISVKAFGAFLIGLVLWAVMSAFSNVGLSLCIMGLVAGLEYVCTAIPFSSIFVLLRYINIFSYVNFFHIFSQYLNLPVFGVLVSGTDLVIGLLPLLCGIFVCTILLTAQKKRPISPANPLLRWGDRLAKKADPWLCGGSLQLQEIKKLLISRKSLVILVLLAVVLFNADPPTREYDPMAMYNNYYQNIYQGPITEDSLAQMEADLQTTQGEGYSALQGMIMEATFAPAGAWIVPTGPYDALWSANYNNYHRTTALIALLFAVLVVAPVSAQENQAAMGQQLRSTSGGRGKLWRSKLYLTLGCATAVWLMVYGTELLLTAKFYEGFQSLSAPIYSLTAFRDCGWSFTIGQTMVLYYLLKLMTLMAAGCICLFLSGLCQKARDAMLVGTAVLILPAALCAIGSDAAGLFSLLLPLGTIEVFYDPIPFLVAALAGFGGALLSWYQQAKHNV